MNFHLLTYRENDFDEDEDDRLALIGNIDYKRAGAVAKLQTV